MTPQSKGFALITGASAGIGAVYAQQLAERGYDLILVARRADRLKSVADGIVAKTGRIVETVIADLSHRVDNQRVEQILRDDVRITMLVNNAGVAAVTPLLGTNVDVASDIVALNIDSLTRLTYAAAPSFVARGRGTIINIASAVAVSVEVLNGVYGASKAFVLALSQSLKHELGDKGVRVQVVLPGAVATDLWANSGLPVENLPKEIVMTTEKMVKAALAGLDQGEFVTAPSLPNLADWESYETARRSFDGKLSLSEPAERYGITAA
jgi:uncharacterized protein